MLQKKSSNNDNENHNNNNTRNNEQHRESVGFAQAVAGNDGKLHQNVKCYDCQKMGHCANHCPNPTGVSNANANSNSNNNDDANQNGNDNSANDDTNNSNDNNNNQSNNNNDNNNNNNNNNTQRRSGTNNVTIRGWNCFQKRIQEKREQLQGVALATSDEKLRKWLLLDNCSTDNIFCNEDYLEDIHEVDITLDLK